MQTSDDTEKVPVGHRAHVPLRWAAALLPARPRARPAPANAPPAGRAPQGRVLTPGARMCRPGAWTLGRGLCRALGSGGDPQASAPPGERAAQWKR